MTRLASLAALAALLAGRQAAAHPLAPSLLSLEEREAGRVEVLWRTPSVGPVGQSLEPVLPCRPAGEASASSTS